MLITCKLLRNVIYYVSSCIEQSNYNVVELNIALYAFDQILIGN